MVPTSILFSPPRNPPALVLHRLAKPWFTLGIEPRAIGELGLDEEGAMLFEGQVAECRTWDELLIHAASKPARAVHFLAGPPHDDVYVYQWDEGKEKRISAELGYGCLRNFTSNEYPPGRYQTALMLALAVAADTDVCVYDREHDKEIFVSVAPAEVLESLARGTLLSKWTPALFLISTRLINKAEVEAAIAKNRDARHLSYHLSTAGYHVLAQYAGA